MDVLNEGKNVLSASLGNILSDPDSDVLDKATLLLLLEELSQLFWESSNVQWNWRDPDALIVPLGIHVLGLLKHINVDSEVGFLELLLCLEHAVLSDLVQHDEDFTDLVFPSLFEDDSVEEVIEGVVSDEVGSETERFDLGVRI